MQRERRRENDEFVADGESEPHAVQSDNALEVLFGG